jgi:hypothetical protein
MAYSTINKERQHMRKTLTLSTALIIAGLSLAGCSSSDSETAATESPMVGGMTECTTEAVQPFVDQAVLALATDGSTDNAMPIEDLECADGWAVATGILGPKDPPADGPQGAPNSFIFQAEGQFWIQKNPEQVCGTGGANYSADAQVPESLYTLACASG